MGFLTQAQKVRLSPDHIYIGDFRLLVHSKTGMQMIDTVRLSATLVFIGSIAMVFISAFVLHLDSLVIVFALLTYLAYAWYALSYVPL